MEQLIQKYIRYFYIALISIISIQLIDTIVATVTGNVHCSTFGLMLLSVTNLILLSGSLIYNINQRFTESKINAKILRFTMALLVGLQTWLCYKANPDIIALGNHIMTIIITEIILNYRIRSIEHLEKLASQFVNKDILS